MSQDLELHIAGLEQELKHTRLAFQRFARATSHDLRSALHTLSGFTELLLRQRGVQLDEKCTEYLGFIGDATQILKAKIEALSQWARLETQTPVITDVPLEMLREATLEHLRKLDTPHLERIDWPIHSGVIAADPEQLVHLIGHLICNALVFHADTLPQVSVQIASSDMSWEITVTDLGIGIPETEFGTIFEVFHRLHTAEEFPGVGMGLAICRVIAANHGGHITLESHVGQGTTVRVTIPSRTKKAIASQG